MELKDQVQGVVLGLFGAYAGGYLADLTSQAENGNPVELAAGLVSLQTPLLGVDLADDSVWVDTILGHLGVSSTSAAYTAAAAWANGELDAGASRANVIIAAVAYLLGDDVEAQYADVATAFKADVAAGVEWSEGDGKDVLGIADLRVEAGNPATGSSFNLTAALAEVAAAQAAVVGNLDAWGAEQTPAKAAGVTTATDIHGAVDTAEAALDALLVAQDTVLIGGDTFAANTYDSVAADDTYTAGDAATAYGQQNAIEDAQLALVKAKIAIQETALDTAVTTTTKAVTDLTNGAALKAAVDSFLTATAALTAAQTAQVNAQAATNAAEATLDAGSNDITAVNFNNDTVISITYKGVGYTSTYNTTTKVWTNSDAAINGLDLSGVQAAAVAEIAANTAVSTATAQKSAALLAVEKIDATQTDGVAFTGAVGQSDTAPADGWNDGEVGTALSGASLSYANAVADVTAFDKQVAAFNAAVAKVDAARADSAELAALEKAVTTASKEITDEGYNVISLATGETEFGSTTKSDVIVLESTLSKTAGAATVYNFGAGDVLSVGSTYVQGTATDLQKGDDAAFEVFFTQSGANTVVTIETKAFGDTANANAVSEITLIGVTASDLELSNGYIQLA